MQLPTGISAGKRIRRGMPLSMGAELVYQAKTVEFFWPTAAKDGIRNIRSLLGGVTPEIPAFPMVSSIPNGAAN